MVVVTDLAPYLGAHHPPLSDWRQSLVDAVVGALDGRSVSPRAYSLALDAAARLANQDGTVAPGGDWAATRGISPEFSAPSETARLYVVVDELEALAVADSSIADQLRGRIGNLFRVEPTALLAAAIDELADAGVIEIPDPEPGAQRPRAQRPFRFLCAVTA